MLDSSYYFPLLYETRQKWHFLHQLSPPDYFIILVLPIIESLKEHDYTATML